MVEPRGRPRLGPDALPRRRVGGVPRSEQLDRDRTAEHLVVGPPYHGHAASAEALDQAVPAREVLHASVHEAYVPPARAPYTGEHVSIRRRSPRATGRSRAFR